MDNEHKQVSWDSPDILWGLTDQSSEAEIMKEIYKIIARLRFMPTATVKNGEPESRIIDFLRMSDGNIYFMTSKGKPFYKQITENPVIVMSSSIDDMYSFRLKAFVKPVPKTDKAIWDEFFGYNPGTVKMYRKNFDVVELFVLEKGQGEVFHLYAEERIRRIRFAFGGMEKEPLTYYISDKCIGCGICQDNCVEQAIYMGEDGKCHIREMDCDVCGICYTKCPMAGTALISRLEK